MSAVKKGTKVGSSQENYPTLKKKYVEMVADLKKEFSFKSVMQVPKIDRIVVSMGLGEAIQNKKVLDSSIDDLMRIVGQRPVKTAAKRSIAGFKLRKGQEIGLKVTLRNQRMYEFLDRLINLALPRVKDFRGLNPNGFDGRGNYSLGIKEQIIFHEIDYDKIEKINGFNIVIVTTARTNKQGYELLKRLGMPFRQ